MDIHVKVHVQHCLQRRFHRPCDERELIVYICGHSRQQRCHELGPRCEERYIKLCDHNDEPDVAIHRNECVIYGCNRYCLNKCRHGRCSKRCQYKCDRLPCNEKCTRRLQCEHYCNGICGEPCVDCLVCQVDNLPLEIRQATKRRGLRHFTVVKLECGHLFETVVLDKHVETFEKQ